MDLRDSKSRLILIVAVLGAVLVIAVASCGGGGSDDSSDGGASQSDGSGNGEETASGDESTASEEQEVLDEVSGGDSITLTFTKAERQEGGFLNVEGTIYNGGDSTFFDAGWAGEEEELVDNGFSMAGASLVAQDEGKRYLILRDTTGRCLCTDFGSGIESGETVSWFAQFPEPETSTSQVQFQIADLPSATLEIR